MFIYRSKPIATSINDMILNFSQYTQLESWIELERPKSLLAGPKPLYILYMYWFVIDHLGSLLLTLFNVNPSMDK